MIFAIVVKPPSRLQLGASELCCLCGKLHNLKSWKLVLHEYLRSVEPNSCPEAFPQGIGEIWCPSLPYRQAHRRVEMFSKPLHSIYHMEYALTELRLDWRSMWPMLLFLTPLGNWYVNIFKSFFREAQALISQKHLCEYSPFSRFLSKYHCYL